MTLPDESGVHDLADAYLKPTSRDGNNFKIEAMRGDHARRVRRRSTATPTHYQANYGIFAS